MYRVRRVVAAGALMKFVLLLFGCLVLFLASILSLVRLQTPQPAWVIVADDTAYYRMRPDGSQKQLFPALNPQKDSTPYWSADGRWVAFQSLREGNWEIYRMRPNGTHLQNLTRNPANDVGVRWVGEWLVFLSAHRGKTDVYRMRGDGTGLENITRTNGQEQNWDVSSDGTWLVFDTFVNNVSDIYKIRMDGSDLQNLSQHPASDASPQWSPDDRQIIFATNRDGDWEIYRMQANGTTPQNITRSPRGDISPSWTADQTRISFWSSRYGGDYKNYTMTPDGTDIREGQRDVPITQTAPLIDLTWQMEPVFLMALLCILGGLTLTFKPENG